MKAIKIWIAQHPEDSQNREVRFDEPDGDYTWLDPHCHGQDCEQAPWVEHVCIPLES